jgi:hypothetical protein
MSKGLQKSAKTKSKLFSKKMRNPSQYNVEKFKAFNTIFNKCKKGAKKAHYRKQFDIHKKISSRHGL